MTINSYIYTILIIKNNTMKTAKQLKYLEGTSFKLHGAKHTIKKLEQFNEERISIITTTGERFSYNVLAEVLEVKFAEVPVKEII